MLRERMYPLMDDEPLGGGTEPVRVDPGMETTGPEEFDTRFGGELNDEQKNFLEQFFAPGAGGEEPAQDTTQEPEPPVVEPEPGVEAVDTSYQPTTPRAPEPELPPEVVETDKKAAHAFGQLRQNNNQLKQQVQQYEQMIDQFATMFNLDPNLDTNAKANSLKTAITAYQAQKQGLPIEVLQKMQDYESRLKNVETKEIDFYNYEEFDKLKKTYGLTDTEVAAFQQELLQNNIDWQNNKIRVSLAYRDMHQADIEKRIADRAVAEYQKKLQEEAARQKKVEQHSTAPVDAAAPEDIPNTEFESKVQSMSDFNALVRQLSKEL